LIRFDVVGDPKPQPRPRAFARNGRARVFDPGTAEGWKALVAHAAGEAGLRMARLPGPLAVWLELRFRRPGVHYRANGDLRPAAPGRHTSRPDVDNCAKAVLDCLTQIGAWDDDSAICDLHVVKRYVDAGEAPGASITVSGAAGA
jgi:Holliday junction resolvase RusA-like endonuclease